MEDYELRDLRASHTLRLVFVCVRKSKTGKKRKKSFFFCTLSKVFSFDSGQSASFMKRWIVFVIISSYATAGAFSLVLPATSFSSKAVHRFGICRCKEERANVNVKRIQTALLKMAEADASGDFDFAAFDAEVKGGSQGGERQSFPTRSGPTMDAQELRELVVAKWGKPYDTRIHRRRDGRQELKYYLQVMWKHVEQQSFHMSDDEYMAQLGAVGELISEWQLADYVREQVRETKQRPGIGVGRGPVSGAVCVSIPLMRENADGSLHPLSDGEGQPVE